MFDHADLPTAWRAMADELRRYGAGEQATVLERCAEELEEQNATRDNQALTPEEAAAFSGYTADHLRRMVSRGQLDDVGGESGVRYRLGDLPIKARRRRERSRAASDVLGYHHA